MNKINKSFRLIAALLACCWTAPSWAQTWPSKPVVLVVGFAPGGPTDIVARTVARALGEQLGQTVVVENKAGAGATLAASQVATAAPDGYSMLLMVSGLTAAESLYKNRRYDLVKDFEGVSLIGTSPNWLLVPKDSPFKSVQDVVRLASASPGKYSYAHGGSGGMTHLSSEYLKALKGLDITPVAYRGNSPALTDLIAGRIDLLFDQPVSSEGFVKSGQLRPLAVTAASRLSLYPEVPTMKESGMPDLSIEVWYGIAVRTGTPLGIVKTLRGALEKTLDRPDVLAALRRSWIDPVSTSGVDMDSRVKADVARWRTLIERNGISAQ